jgi:hypothetical protein
MTELMEKIGIVHNTGCKIEERKTTSRPANDVVENTNKRRINTKEKPRRKSLTQITGFLRKMLMKLPRKIIANQVRQEKRESAEQRLRLKTGSFLIKLKYIMRSDSETMKKKAKPKIKPKVKPR